MNIKTTDDLMKRALKGAEIDFDYEKLISDATDARILYVVWISCRDQMPTENERVLCVTRKGIKILSLSPAFMGCRYPHPADWIGESVSSIVQRIALDDVSYWMPLPEVPNV